MSKFYILIIAFACLAIAFGGGYWTGQNNQKFKYITKQVEVIKYVEKEKAAIYSKPNANRDQLLQLMRQDIF
jgi:hypothetical protein